MPALEAKKNIYWVGVLDKELRNFDIIMHTDYGTTYNSYLVRGSEKTVLFDTVKEPFFEEHLDDLKTKVIVCDEISSGIVPLKKEERFYREEVGRILQFLSRESNSIIRIFCGIEVVLKDE